MNKDEINLESAEVNRHLFREESAFQKKRWFLYSSLVAFTILLVITFLLLNSGLAFALTCGVSIGISVSILSLSLMRVGSKSFWLYFAWFLVVLLGLSWFNVPEAVNDRLASFGLSQDIIIFGTIFQVVLFFLCVIYAQCRDFRRKPLDIETSSVPVDTKLRKKSPKPPKVKEKSSRKGILKKFKVNREKAQSISEKFTEPEIYSDYRKLAMKIGFSLMGLSALNLLIFSGISYLMPFTFAAMFMVTLLLILVPMIKPGTKKFWYSVGVIALLVIPTFVVAVKMS